MAPIDEALFAQFHANLVSNLPDQHILENIITYCFAENKQKIVMTYGKEGVGPYVLDVKHHLPQLILMVKLQYPIDKMIPTQVQSSLCQISSSHPYLEKVQMCGIVCLLCWDLALIE